MSRALAETALGAWKRFVRWSADHELVWYGCDLVGKVHARRYDVARSLVVSGGPRSGTTWLMEMIGGITGYVTANEPEMPIPPSKVKRHLGYELEWRTYRDPDVEDPPFTEALHRILSGAYLRPSSVRRNLATASALMKGTPLVLKFIRANLYLPYLHARFPRTKIVQIVRNPYAVIASQLRHPIHWKGVHDVAPFYREVVDVIPHLAPPPALSLPEEILAAHWCIEHAYLEESMPRLAGVHFVRYEDLYNQPESALRQLTDHLECGWDERHLDVVRRRSRSVQPGSPLLANGDPTTSYKRTLTEAQRERIGVVLAAYGHPFYRPL